jgi:hypothetical protein
MMAVGGGSPCLYQNADFLMADFGCVTHKKLGGRQQIDADAGLLHVCLRIKMRQQTLTLIFYDRN